MSNTPPDPDASDSREDGAPTKEACAKLYQEVVSELAYVQTIADQPGSLLSADNAFVSQFHTTMHELAVIRLFSSLDHLQLTAVSLGTGSDLVIFSQFSLVRSALAGASTAYWLLSGETSQRRMRALRLAYYDLEHESIFARSMAKESFEDIDPPNMKAIQNSQNVLDSTPARLDAIYAEYCSLAKAAGENIPKRRGFGFQEVPVIEEISEMMRNTGRIKKEAEISLQYRIMSGFVHNCSWAIRSGAGMKLIETDDGQRMQITGNPGNIYRGARTAFIVTLLAKARLSELAAKT